MQNAARSLIGNKIQDTELRAIINEKANAPYEEAIFRYIAFHLVDTDESAISEQRI